MTMASPALDLFGEMISKLQQGQESMRHVLVQTAHLVKRQGHFTRNAFTASALSVAKKQQ